MRTTIINNRKMTGFLLIIVLLFLYLFSFYGWDNSVNFMCKVALLWVVIGFYISTILLIKISRKYNGKGSITLSVFIFVTITILSLFFGLLSFSFLLNIRNYGLLMDNNERFFYREVKKIKTKEQNSFALKEFTNFDWDNFNIVEPYNPSEDDSYVEFYKNGKIVQVIGGYKGFFRDGSIIHFKKNNMENIEDKAYREKRVKLLKNEFYQPSSNDVYTIFIN